MLRLETTQNNYSNLLSLKVVKSKNAKKHAEIILYNVHVFKQKTVFNRPVNYYSSKYQQVSFYIKNAITTKNKLN
jgi:hypothetical protein